MTEEEARAKWCPFVRFHGTPSDDCLSNRDSGIDDGNPGMSRCIGSRCMAWRPIIQNKPVLKDGTEVEPGKIYLRADIVKTNIFIGGGFCGLIGKP